VSRVLNFPVVDVLGGGDAFSDFQHGWASVHSAGRPIAQAIADAVPFVAPFVQLADTAEQLATGKAKPDPRAEAVRATLATALHQQPSKGTAPTFTPAHRRAVAQLEVRPVKRSLAPWILPVAVGAGGLALAVLAALLLRRS
jgi:hypothetical protein